MLHTLPSDVLVEIILYLSTSQKVQLVLTCKKLKDLIVRRCLYDTLELFSQEDKDIETIVLHFRKNPSKGQQVKVLRIRLDGLSNQLFREIPLIFPNVVDFYDFENESTSRPEEAYTEFIKWKDTLEALVYSGSKDTFALFVLLEKNVFSHLTTLTTTLLNNDENRVDLLECLKNTPALENLDILFISSF